MKKLLLFLVLSLCFCLFAVACGEGNTTTASETSIGDLTTTVPHTTLPGGGTTAAITTAEGTTATVTSNTTAAVTTEKPVDYGMTPTNDYFYMGTETAFLSDRPLQTTGNETAGIQFTVAENTYLTSWVGYCPSWNNNTGSLTVSIYRWKGSYAATVAEAPAAEETFVNYTDNSPLNMHLKEGVIGEGEWYAEYGKGQASDPVGIWSNYQPTVQNNYVTFRNAYRNGQVMATYTPYCYGTYVTYEKNTEEIAVQPYTKLNPDKAHVIVLSGQSNASGNSSITYLKATSNAEDFARYYKGYDNILIDYSLDGTRQSNGFVPVALGQATAANLFGPEIGLADYLTKTYPGETFYIIKASWCGTALSSNWKPGQQVFNYVKSSINASLDRLKADGLDPEIFAFLWMQGESDAFDNNNAKVYAENFEDTLTRLFQGQDAYIAENGYAILDAAISDSPMWTFGAIVNGEKREFSKSSPNRYYIDTLSEKLGCMKENNDVAHYDSQDMIRLGELYGEYITKVIENSKK